MDRLATFVGRHSETAELSSVLEEALAGRLSCALVVGEPGIGKTRIVREFARDVAARGIPVMEGNCVECHETPAYGPWREAISRLADPASRTTLAAPIDPGSKKLAMTVPEIAERLSAMHGSKRFNAPSGRLELLSTVTGLLAQVAAPKGLVVVIDNLQLADPDSLTLLEYLAHEAAFSKIMILATAPEPGPPLDHPLTRVLGELVKLPTFCRIRLEGLSRGDTMRYLRKASGRSLSASVVDSIHAASEGNPLFLVEIVRDMLTRGASAPVGRVSAGIRDFVGRRLAALPKSSVLALSTASVIGRRFDPSLLARLLDAEGADHVADDLGRAEQLGFVEKLEYRLWQFTHAMLQEALYQELPAAHRAELHLAVADLMESDEGPTTPGWHGELLRHVFAGLGSTSAERTPTKRLVHLTQRAAHEALEECAPERAVEVLERTLAMVDTTEGRSEGKSGLAALLYLHGRALHEAGRPEGQESLVRAFELYVADGDTKHALEVALTRSHQRMHRLDLELDVSVVRPVEELRRTALTLVEPDSLDEGRLLSDAQDREDLERALHIARRERDEELEAWTLSRLAVIHGHQGDFEASIALWRQVLEQAQARKNRDAMNWFLYMYTYPLAASGDLAAARVISRKLVENARLARSRRLQWRAHYAFAALAGMAGDWKDCREHSDRVFSLLPANTSTFSGAFAHVNLALVEYETGNPDAGSRLFRSFSSSTTEPPGWGFPCAAAKIARITGEEAHLEELGHRLGAMPEPGHANPFVFWRVARHVARALVAVLLGDRKSAALERRFFGRWSGCYSPIGMAGRSFDAILGLLEATEGELDSAIGHLHDGVEFCRASGLRPELAWTCLDLSESLLRRGAAGDHQAASRALEEGGALARSLHMTPLLARIEACRKRIAESPEWQAVLSRREAQVLGLVARGYKNREIGDQLYISERTVANHMRNILDKLGASNRAEATAWAVSHGIDGGS